MYNCYMQVYSILYIQKENKVAWKIENPKAAQTLIYSPVVPWDVSCDMMQFYCL